MVAALFALPSTIMFLVNKNVILGYSQYVALFDLLVTSVFPLCVIVFSYIMIHRHLVESSCGISEGTQHTQLNTRKITAKVVLGLTVVFLISYVPLYALHTYIFFNKGWFSGMFNYMLFLYEVSYYLVSINPCLNPVALFCTSALFRKHLKRYLTCSCKANSPPTDIDLTITN
jgi:hypothetical protein